MQYINWDNLKNIPFFLCQVVEDKENQDIDIYYLGERVFHDYDHVGHYLRSAIVLFRRIRNRTADWVNLSCGCILYTLCIGFYTLYFLIYQFHRKLRIYLWRTFLSAWTVLSLFRGKALLYW